MFKPGDKIKHKETGGCGTFVCYDSYAGEKTIRWDIEGGSQNGHSYAKHMILIKPRTKTCQ